MTKKKKQKTNKQKKHVGRIDQLRLGLGVEVESGRNTAQKKSKITLYNIIP